MDAPRVDDSRLSQDFPFGETFSRQFSVPPLLAKFAPRYIVFRVSSYKVQLSKRKFSTLQISLENTELRRKIRFYVWPIWEVEFRRVTARIKSSLKPFYGARAKCEGAFSIYGQVAFSGGKTCIFPRRESSSGNFFKIPVFSSSNFVFTFTMYFFIFVVER